MQRIQVNIVGVGERRTGTGKNGKPYDFVPVAFTFVDPFIKGLNAGNCNLPGYDVENFKISAGSVIDAVVVYRNYQPVIAVVLGG